MPDWEAIVLLSASPLELVVRGTVTFVVLMVLFRVVGQRESGGLGLTDLLLVVLVAEAANPGLVGDATTIADGVVLVVTLLFWSVALDAACYRWPRFSVLVKARPRLLIEDGRLNRRLMRREFMTDEEMLTQLRLRGVQDPATVRRAYLEPNGMVSVIPAGSPPQ